MSDNSAYLSSVRTFSTAYRPGDQSGGLYIVGEPGPEVIIAVPGSLTPDEADDFKMKFKEQFAGFVPRGSQEVEPSEMPSGKCLYCWMSVDRCGCGFC